MIGIVILNYNSYKDTIALVKELQNQTLAKDLKIVVVDNCSPNDSFLKLKHLEEFYSNTIVIKTTANLGYAKGNNFGLDYLDKYIKPDYVAILNNDIIFNEDCFEKLVERYKILETPAIIAPKQLDINNNEVVPYRLNSFLDDCLNMFYVFKIFHKRNSLKFKDNTGLSAMKVEMIPGSFMFSSFITFQKMGFFYPNTFLFVEERFIATKASMLNLNNYIVLDETYVHAHSKTINSVFGQLEKFKLLYDGWVEYTKVYRNNSKLKVLILKTLIRLSIFELKLVLSFRKVFSK